MTARRAGPATEVSLSAARSCALESTSCSIASRSAATSAERGRAGGLGHRGRIALKRRVHWRAPAPAAGAAARVGAQRGDGLVDEVAVRLGVDLAADDPLDDLHDDLAHPGRRLLDGALAGQRDLDVGVAHDALVLALAPGLGVGAHLLGRAVGRGDDFARLLAGLLEHGAALVVGRFGVGPGLVRRLERLPDLLLALLHRLVDRRQHVLVDEEDQDDRRRSAQ